MSATELWTSVVACAACVGAVWAAVRLVRRRAVEANEWISGKFKDHTLAYSERMFRSGGARQVVARVDRAYRARDGLITLVELKTRATDRSHLSDVIELSAQRVALAGETEEPVARIGWVVVESSAGRSAHRVTLMSPQAVRNLASRRDALLAGTASPEFPAQRGMCASCAYRLRCHPRRLPT
jgi:CRISPR-associated exonuclease Cas4